MGNKRGRYENAGRIKSIHTVNFRDADEILTILESFRGNEAMERHIAELYIKMQAILVDYDFTHKQKKGMCLNLLSSHWMIRKMMMKYF